MDAESSECTRIDVLAVGGLIQYIIPSFPMFNVIKTHGSESRGQEEAALMHARLLAYATTTVS